MRCEIEKRGNPNQKTGLIGVGVANNGKKYKAKIYIVALTTTCNKNLGTFDTKEQAGIAYMYDRFVVDKSTEEVSTLH